MKTSRKSDRLYKQINIFIFLFYYYYSQIKGYEILIIIEIPDVTSDFTAKVNNNTKPVLSISLILQFESFSKFVLTECLVFVFPLTVLLYGY